MKKNKTGTLYLLLFLIIITLAGGIIGLIASLNMKPSNPSDSNDDGKFKVTYKYYVDNTETSNIVKQEKIKIANEEFEGVIDEKEMYTFEKYECSNEVKGSWDNKKWEFTPDLTADSTCKLYFLKNFHEVQITTSNALLPNNTNTQKVLVDRNNTKTLNLLPSEGYKFGEAKCTEGANASYDETTKDLVIGNVNKDTKCDVSFIINGFTVEVEASNAELKETKKTANYGDTVTLEITPKENYAFESVTCTNEQKAEFNGNTLTIKGLTNDSKCTVNFKFTIVKYTVSLTVENGTLLESSKSPQTTNNNMEVSFAISKNDGYLFTGAVLDCGADKVESELTSNVLKIKNINKNLTCKYILKEDKAN